MLKLSDFGQSMATRAARQSTRAAEMYNTVPSMRGTKGLRSHLAATHLWVRAWHGRSVLILRHSCLARSLVFMELTDFCVVW